MSQNLSNNIQTKVNFCLSWTIVRTEMDLKMLWIDKSKEQIQKLNLIRPQTSCQVLIQIRIQYIEDSLPRMASSQDKVAMLYRAPNHLSIYMITFTMKCLQVIIKGENCKFWMGQKHLTLMKTKLWWILP